MKNFGSLTVAVTLSPPLFRTLMPDAEKKRQALGTLTRRFASASPVRARLSGGLCKIDTFSGRENKIEVSPFGRDKREGAGGGNPFSAARYGGTRHSSVRPVVRYQGNPPQFNCVVPWHRRNSLSALSSQRDVPLKVMCRGTTGQPDKS